MVKIGDANGVATGPDQSQRPARFAAKDLRPARFLMNAAGGNPLVAAKCDTNDGRSSLARFDVVIFDLLDSAPAIPVFMKSQLVDRL